MQIAATNPLSVTRDGIDSVVVDKEKEIFTEQAKLSGKPDNVLEKIIEGRIEKFYQESCLLEQSFIKDSDKIRSRYSDGDNCDAGREHLHRPLLTFLR